MRRIIGLTGGIGAGKSTVSAMLTELGAYIIDADKIGHAILEPAGAAYGEVAAAFGGEILGEDGSIDRGALAKIVFADGEKRALLNAITHPKILAEVSRRIGQADAAWVVIDAALLLEAGFARLCDEVWLVTAGQETRIARIMARSGYSRAQAEARMASQMSDAARMAAADVIIENSGSLDALREAVCAAMKQAEERWKNGRNAR